MNWIQNLDYSLTFNLTARERIQQEIEEWFLTEPLLFSVYCILAQKRKLTRMRPSRRFGFDQMSSRCDFTTRYFRVITTFFKYGIQEIDVIMFDVKVQGNVMTLDIAKKNIKEFKVKGRGGAKLSIATLFLYQIKLHQL